MIQEQLWRHLEDFETLPWCCSRSVSGGILRKGSGANQMQAPARSHFDTYKVVGEMQKRPTSLLPQQSFCVVQVECTIYEDNGDLHTVTTGAST